MPNLDSNLVNTLNNAGYWKQDNALQLGDDNKITVDQNQKAEGAKALDSRNFYALGEVKELGSKNEVVRQRVNAFLQSIAGNSEQVGMVRKDLNLDIVGKLHVGGGTGPADVDVYKPLSVRAAKALVAKAYGTRAETTFMTEHAARYGEIVNQFEDVKVRAMLAGKTDSLDKLFAKLEAALGTAGAELEKAEAAAAKEANAPSGQVSAKTNDKVKKAKAQIASAYEAFARGLAKMAGKMPDVRQLTDSVLADYAKTNKVKLGDIVREGIQAKAQKLLRPGMDAAALKGEVKGALAELVQSVFTGETKAFSLGNKAANVVLPRDFSADLATLKRQLDEDFKDVKQRQQEGKILTTPKKFSLDGKSWKSGFLLRQDGLSLSDDFETTTVKRQMELADGWNENSCLKVGNERRKFGILSTAASVCDGNKLQYFGVLRALQARPDLLACKVADELGVDGALTGCEYELSRNPNGDILVTASTRDDSAVSVSVKICVHADGTCEELGFPTISSNDKLAERLEIEARRKGLSNQMSEFEQLCANAKSRINETVDLATQSAEAREIVKKSVSDFIDQKLQMLEDLASGRREMPGFETEFSSFKRELQTELITKENEIRSFKDASFSLHTELTNQLAEVKKAFSSICDDLGDSISKKSRSKFGLFKNTSADLDKQALANVKDAFREIEINLANYWEKLAVSFACSETNGEAAKDEVLTCAKAYVDSLLKAANAFKVDKQKDGSVDWERMYDALNELRTVPRPSFTFDKFTAEAKTQMAEHLKLLSFDLKQVCPNMSVSVTKAVDTFVVAVNKMVEKSKGWRNPKLQAEFSNKAKEICEKLVTEFAAASQKGVNLDRGLGALLAAEYAEVSRSFSEFESNATLQNLKSAVTTQIEMVKDWQDIPRPVERAQWNNTQLSVLGKVKGFLSIVEDALKKLDKSKPVAPGRVLAIQRRLVEWCKKFFSGNIGTVAKMLCDRFDYESRYLTADNVKAMEALINDCRNLTGTDNVDNVKMVNPFAAMDEDIKSFDELAKLTKAATFLSGTMLNVASDDLWGLATDIILSMDNCPAKFKVMDDNGNVRGLSPEGEKAVKAELVALVDEKTRELARQLTGEEESFVTDSFVKRDDIKSALGKRFETLVEMDQVVVVQNRGPQKDDGLLPGEVLKRGKGVFGIDVLSLDETQKANLNNIIAMSFMTNAALDCYEFPDRNKEDKTKAENLANFKKVDWLSRAAEKEFPFEAHNESFIKAIFSGDIPLDGSLTCAGLKFLSWMVTHGGAKSPMPLSVWEGRGFHTKSVGDILQILQDNGISQQALQEYFTQKNWPSSLRHESKGDRPVRNELNDIVFGRGEIAAQHLGTVLSLLFEINGSRGLGLDDLCVRVFGKGILEVTPQDVKEIKQSHRHLFVEGEVNFHELDPVLALDGESHVIYGLVSGDVLLDKQNAALARRIYEAVNQVAVTKNPQTLDIKDAKVTIVPQEGKEGFFTLEIATRQGNGPDKVMKVPMGFTLTAFSERMTDAFLANPTLVKSSFLQTLLPAKKKTEWTTSRDRQLAMNFISAATGIQAATLSNVSTDKVVEIAHRLSTVSLSQRDANRKMVEGEIKAEKNAQGEKKVVLFNGADTLELYERMEMAPAGEVEKSVYVPNVRGARPGETLVEAQKRQLHEFVAELVLPNDTTKFDLDTSKKGLSEGAILRQTLQSHRYEVALLISHPELLDDFSLVGKTDGTKQDAVKEALVRFADNLKNQIVKSGGLKNFFGRLQDETGESKAAFDKTLGDLVSPLNVAADKLLEDLQGRLTQSMKAAFEKTSATRGNQPFWKKSIDQMSGGTLDVNSGYGRFLMDSMERYFTSREKIDRRRMASAILRTSSAGSSQSDMLASMIKGAGPVFQKLMQGLPESALPNELREVVKDLKSNLPPISPEMVRATLFDMVKQSKGAITRIELQKSLGAATVGQAFLCKIYTKDKPNGEECVLKVLRPDAQNRANREYDFFLKKANDTPGMQGVFENRLRSILDELDFTIEATNVKRGVVYNSGVVKDGITGIRSMELHPYIAPTVNAMVVRKAPGTTYDRYTRDLAKKVDAELGDKEFTVVERDGEIWYENPNALTIVNKHQKLDALYQDALARQKNLISFSEKWFYESVFGDGFAHMDVHSGNLMCDKDTLTVIDYGNAVTLSADDRKNLKWALAWLGVRDLGNFLSYFKKMLPKEALAMFEKNEVAIKQDLNDLFARFDTTDAGRAFSATLHIIEQHGVPLPGGLFGLMQSLQRLDESIRLVNEQLDRIRTAQSKLVLVDKPTDPNSMPSIFDFFQDSHCGIGCDKQPLVHPGVDDKDFKETLDKIKKGVGRGRMSFADWSGYFGSTTSIFRKEMERGFTVDTETGKYPAGTWSARIVDEFDKALKGEKNKLEEMLTALGSDCKKMIGDSALNNQKSVVETDIDAVLDLLSKDEKNQKDCMNAVKSLIADVLGLLRLFCSFSMAPGLDSENGSAKVFSERFVDFADPYMGLGGAIVRGAKSFIAELKGSVGTAFATLVFDSPIKLKDSLQEQTKQEYRARNRMEKLLGNGAPYEKFAETNSLSQSETAYVRRLMKEFRYPAELPALVQKHGLKDDKTDGQLVESLQFNIKCIEDELTKAGLSSRFAKGSASRSALVKYALMQVSVNHPEFYLGLGAATDAMINRVSGADQDVKDALLILREIGRNPPNDALSEDQEEEINEEFSIL